MILAIALFAGGSIILIAAAIYNYYYNNEGDIVRDRVRDMGKAAASAADQYRELEFKDSLAKRLFMPFAKKITDFASNFAPPRLYQLAVDSVEDAGGFSGGVAGFIATVAGCAAVALLLGFWYIATKDVNFFGAIFVLLFALVAGAGLPYAFIQQKIEDRREQMRRSMPDVLDLLCVSVQAGLGFDAALGRVTAKMKGPLLDEMSRLLQELRMGVTRRNALLRLAKRCGIEEMKLFAAAIIQAERLGVGMAQVLEIQAGNMRELRRQRAHEAAAKLPVKILLPTVVFILPVLFVVILGPPLISISKNLLK